MLISPFTSFSAAHGLGQDQCLPSHYLTITHWLEMSKFDAAADWELIEFISHLPHPVEVVRFSRRNAKSWRSDWQLRRPQMVILGVAYFFSAATNAYVLKEKIVKEVMMDGISEGMANDLVDRGMALANSPCICVIASDGVPQLEINKRLRLISKKHGSLFRVNQWCGRNSSPMLHSWAMNLSIPVYFYGAKNLRLAGADKDALVKATDHFIVIDRKSHRFSERFVEQIKILGKSVDIFLSSEVDKEQNLFN